MVDSGQDRLPLVLLSELPVGHLEGGQDSGMVEDGGGGWTWRLVEDGKWWMLVEDGGG